MRYTIYTYQDAGFQHGWKETQADDLPDGAEVVTEFKPWDSDRRKVYAIDGGAK